MRPYDLAVVGAGPAGLACAVAAGRAGLRVVLVDGGPRLGGQYYRHAPPSYRATRPGVLHHGWRTFAALAAALPALDVDVRLRHRVWAAETAPDGLRLHCLAGDREETPVTFPAARLVVATGAHDRVLPFPGWDLPGVLTAGGAQALLKGELVLAGRKVVVAGTGPFLLPVAAGLAAAGARVRGVFEAGRTAGLAAHPGILLAHPGKLAEAAGYGLTLAAHRVPYRGRHAVVAAHGNTALTSVTVAKVDAGWGPIPGTERMVPCDTLAVGYGFTPQLELALQLGCATRTDADGGHIVAVDARQATDVPGVYAAGESTGVGGAPLALVEGRIAGLAAAGRPAPARLLRLRARLREFARALHAAYPVRDGWRGWLRDDTVVCRCEEVPYARLREALALGAADARSVKLLARPGMGPCQGRMCGYAVGRLAGSPEGLGHRPIAQPIRLADLARFEGDPT
ncbi:NAD(P)/FAD-dependent oxidoreductase [Rhizohabitans arisaemae]|uniref:NAD(P)/FAD-dependent oxidoreductase n=1 Tax=Rhizohabitans arisaemae TaxID=2720610 RepID=UPI0024B1D4EC|nr:NAD(P)/FAD-dependent oxidoreductase [Rhizohabitans arisaemae]